MADFRGASPFSSSINSTAANRVVLPFDKENLRNHPPLTPQATTGRIRFNPPRADQQPLRVGPKLFGNPHWPATAATRRRFETKNSFGRMNSFDSSTTEVQSTTVPEHLGGIVSPSVSMDYETTTDTINTSMEGFSLEDSSPASGRKECVNPVSLTLLNDGREDFHFLVQQDCSPRRHSPAHVRVQPPLHVMRPRPMRPTATSWRA